MRLFALWCFCAIAAVSSGAEVRVAAAASLADVLKEIAAPYERHSGDHVVLIFGGSNTLARQIREGAPIDLFISADNARMDELERKQLILPESRQALLSNTLAVVIAVDRELVVKGPESLLDGGVKRIALGDPNAVPAGIYAREYLESTGLWKSLQRKIVSAENVRGALAAVESGNADAAIVYRTDAAVSKKVRVAFEVPVQAGPRILYPVALLRESRQPDAARKFLEHLLGQKSRRIFEKFGFVVLSPDPP
jgi:molybdate transport system substrate-binding protein